MVWWLRSPNIGVTNLSMKWLTISIFQYCSNDNQTQIETKPTYLKTGHKSMKTATLKTFVAEVNEGIGVHVSFARNKNQVKRWQSVQVNCWKKEAADFEGETFASIKFVDLKVLARDTGFTESRFWCTVTGFEQTTI